MMGQIARVSTVSDRDRSVCGEVASITMIRLSLCSCAGHIKYNSA